MNPGRKEIRKARPPGGKTQPALRKACLNARQNTELATLKNRLLFEAAGDLATQRLLNLLRLAANEAEALAWQTPCPHLALPLLLEEKIEFVRNYARRQARIKSLGQLQVASRDPIS